MYELYSFVEHTLYSRPVIRAVLFDTQFCLILKTEYNPHYNSTKMNMFSSSYNLLSTYECLSSKSQMYFPFITLYWFCSCMILACTIQKLFKICFILINLWFLTWTTLQLTSFRGSMEYHPGFPGNAINRQPSERALADHSSRHGCQEMTSYRAFLNFG